MGIYIILIITIIVFYFVWYYTGKVITKKDLTTIHQEQLDTLINTYNKDTAELHNKCDNLHRSNVELAAKLRDVETDLISYRVKVKSVETDNNRLKECNHKCWKEIKLNKKPIVTNIPPKKRRWRPAKK